MLAQVEKEEIWENICNERNPSPKEQDRNSQPEHLETKKSKAVNVDQEKGAPPPPEILGQGARLQAHHPP